MGKLVGFRAAIIAIDYFALFVLYSAWIQGGAVRKNN
jgi:hypothetical protein